MGTKGWTRIENLTWHLHDRDIYGYDTDVGGHLRIEAFAMSSAGF